MPRTTSPAAPVERLAYTIDEALQALPIGRSTMFELISAGRLRTFTIGRRRLVPVDALRALIASAETDR